MLRRKLKALKDLMQDEWDSDFDDELEDDDELYD